MTNPDNFLAHRRAMLRFSKVIGALASAYQLTGDEKYVKQAVLHLRAWFIDTETLMNPEPAIFTSSKRIVHRPQLWHHRYDPFNGSCAGRDRNAARKVIRQTNT
jgi:hypothetical protein